ncbi:VQ motif-containing protein 9 [Euphorbia lathyris]|uniref:VQ motif-containing protein 9 n=1 Tax=Euphorbia lathyris TaxID=212925 RepID=UPI003313949B
MDKSCQSSSSVDSTITSGNNYLKNLNKLSHKISKPIIPTSNNSHLFNNNLHQSQPPVYNINKNDFRDVVQKLTGSPAHQTFSTPPPIHPPKPPSSRLQRIRPPPLAHVTNRPPHPPPPPLSPLPPFPPVHAAAESPVSAYMRYLHNSIPTAHSGFSTPQQVSAMMTSHPPSPLPFGCLNSPRSPHPFFSPGLLLSPSAFPVSPTLQMPSPRWRSL